MTTFKTGNPIGSTAVKDLYDNAENLDVFVNDRTKRSEPDRLGVDRKTWHGIEKQVEQQQSEFADDQAQRESEFVDAQADKQQRFNLLLANSGYEYLGEYAAGIEITEYNQVLRDAAGELWRAAATTTLPYTTDGTGLPEGGAFVAVGDADIRNDLAAGVGAGKGGLLVRGAVIYVDTIADLQALPTSDLVDGQVVTVKDKGDYQYSAAADELYPVSSFHNFHRLGDPIRRHHPSIPDLPMGDQGLDGQAVHPCVVKIPGGFGPQAFVYWMAVTPYQNGNDQTENPCIFGSHDGAAWEVPDGVTNPLVASPGTSQDHLSDPNLLHHNGELWYYYRESIRSVDPREDNIYLIKSSDGANWSAPVQCDLPDSDLALSPAVVHDGSQFVMYLLRRANQVDRRTSSDGINWSLPTPVSFVGASSAWHIHVVICNGRYEMLINTSVTNGILVFAYSDLSDGLSFERIRRVVEPEYDFESGGLYHGCLTPEGAEDARVYDIWYSAQAGGRWTVAHVAATLSGEGLVPTYERQPVTVFGPITATAGHFNSISTRVPINVPALMSGISNAEGATRHARTILSGEGYVSGYRSAAIATTDAVVEGVQAAIVGGTNNRAYGNSSAIISGVNCETSGDSSFIVGSLNCTAAGNRNSVLSSNSSHAASPSGSAQVICSTDNSWATGSRSLVAASSTSVASGDRSVAIAAVGASVSADRSAVVGGTRNATSGSGSCAVIASSGTENATAFSLALGTGSGDASTANQNIRLEGEAGTIRATNTTIQGLDYAELFPNGTGSEIEPGTILALSNGSVVPAVEGDSIIGVVSHTYGILGGDSFSCWQGRYLKDEWGRDVWEEIEDPDDETKTIRMRKENPDYNPSFDYLPRTDRPNEWTPVGLLGQVLVRVSGSVQTGDSVAAESGIGVISNDLTGLLCLSIESKYDPERGYAIAKCLINVRV